jgi:predicted dehydrogenase
MGGKLSMAGLAASERFELIGVADRRAEARREVEQRYPGVATFPSHTELFAQLQPDVVCVSTWPPSHLEVATAALELPLKGILVEKPLADNIGDGRKILDHIRAKKLPVVVPHGLLVSNHGRQIIDLIRQGAIGPLKLIEIQCTGWDIINAGIHWLNFCVVLLAGEPVDFVMAACDTTSRTYRDAMQVETLAVTYLQTRSGVRIVMNTGDEVKISQEDKKTLFRLIGSEGTLDFYAWEPRYRLLNSQYPQGQLIEVEPGPLPAHQRYLEMLAAQIDQGQPDDVLAEHSLAALELCEAAYLSHRHRCVVTLPLARFEPPQATDWAPGQPYSGQGGGRDGRQLPL